MCEPMNDSQAENNVKRNDITAMLNQYAAGNQVVLNELFPAIYDELRRLAASKMRQERAGHTLQPTALVNEVYLRLINQHSVDWHNRAHFFGLAAEMMRRILVNYAVERQAQKRGSGETALALDEALAFASDRSIDVIELNDALSRLSAFAPRQAKVIEMRFFGGLNIEETAAVLNISPETVKRDWRAGKAWLFSSLQSESDSSRN